MGHAYCRTFHTTFKKREEGSRLMDRYKKMVDRLGGERTEWVISNRRGGSEHSKELLCKKIYIT